ncbi:hypothetical protein [Arenicella xantha]|nr:hypothetical protein [Arenicella xantha]
MRVAILFVLFFSTTVYAQDEFSIENTALISDLNESIGAVAKKHGLSVGEVLQVANSYQFNSPYLSACGKGGFSTLGNGQYISNNDKFNRIGVTAKIHRHGLDDIWKGGMIGDRELVIIEDGIIKSSVKLASSTEKLQFVLFETEKVRIFNWTELSGGHYLRNCK